MKDQDLYSGLEIAVIGMSGRFPGANDLDTFWENLVNGVESITFYSERELEELGVDPGLIKNPGFVKTRGGLIEEGDFFDAHFFGYSTSEAEALNPQTRLFHECCWEALEDAGYNPWTYSGNIGIYGGGRNSFDWEALSLLSGKRALLGEVLVSTLCDKDSMVSRISYNFNLRGPSFVLNTACSTGLVAIHLACQALLSGECDMALAGASAFTLVKPVGYLYREGDVMSPDGHTRAFDAGAAGLNYSDGVGAVLLKSMEDAVANGDHIYALIKGSAINNDGHSKVSYTAPAVKAQETVIRTAHCMAGIEPESISYIETHGTATNIGDPIEFQALKQAFNSDKKNFCAIGSLKTNVGHMTEAAGIGGFIKTVLALKNGLIPPSLHYQNPNPAIDFENSPFYVCSKLTPWQRGPNPLRAGVSAFARGGTNAHIVLEEEPREIEENKETTTDREYQLILLSARTSPALEKMSKNFVSYLEENRDIDIANAAYTLQVGRKTFEHRRKLTCAHISEVIESLSNQSLSRSNAQKDARSYFSKDEDRPVVFMFPGLGSHYTGMGQDLYRCEPLFQKTMKRCFDILISLTGKDLEKILYPGANDIKNNLSAETVQPLLFSFEYALAELVMSWGIIPSAMIGYSFGEYTAACVSGVLCLEDALALIVSRVNLINKVPGGRMLSVPLAAQEVEPLLLPGLAIAIDNGPSCIVAGPTVTMETFAQQMKTMRHMCFKLDGDFAIHSMMMDAIREDFKMQAGRYRFYEPRIPYISNVTGKYITAAEAMDPAYWARHLREMVHFSDGIHELLHEKQAIFIEIGPGRDLSVLIGRYIDPQSEQKVIHLIRPQGKNVHDLKYLLNKIGDLWLYGKKIDWVGFYGEEKRKRISLPTYPFQRRQYTIEISTESPLTNLNIGMNLKIPPIISPMAKSSPATSAAYSQPEIAEKTLNITTANNIERVIAGIWGEMLGVNPVDSDADFLELGGDSLKAITVLSRVHKIYNTLVPLAEFFKKPTLKHLAAYVENADKYSFTSIPAAEIKSYYPLSSIQKRLFIFQQMDPGNISYNLPQAYIMEGDVDRLKIEDIFHRLINQHESFRTSFVMPGFGNEPVQIIHQARDVKFDLEFYTFAGMAGNKEKDLDRFIRPFDLSRAPLVRARLIEKDNKKYILMIDMHHIISDGVSNALFIQDFVHLYAGLELPALKIQYKDYSEWQNTPEQKERQNRQESFWVNELAGVLPMLNLPFDYVRTAMTGFEGDREYFKISRESTTKLKELAKNEEATLYMVMLSIFNVLLSKLSAQTEIVIGVDTAGRTHADFERIIGVFINTLVLRVFPGKEKTFRRFLQEVKTKALEIFENQDYPFDLLADKLVKVRNPLRNPIFDVLFSYEHFEMKPLELPETFTPLNIKPYDESTVASKMDINVKVRGEDVIEIIIEYKTKLFKKSTIQRFANYFIEIVEAIIQEPGILLKDIRLTQDLLRINQDLSKLDLEF